MNMHKGKGRLALLCGAAALAAASAAGAQSEESAATLEEVVVTAQKREQNVQDVPIAIDAVSRDAILAQRVAGPDDLLKLLPNLSLKTASAVNSGFAIRGVGTQNFHLTASQAVGLYFDEVSQVTPFTSQLGLFDMERIEVLRGPQNTLFGRNTTGGAVNFITRRPDPEDGANGYVNVNLGNFGRLDGEGAVGFKLGDTFALRAAGQVQNRDGVFRDVDSGDRIGSTDKQSARLGLGWNPSDATSAWLSLHYGKSDPRRVPRKATGRFLADNATTCPQNDDGAAQFDGVSACFARNKTGVSYNPSLDGWRNAHDAANNTARVELSGALLRVEHDFGPVSLVSLTGYDEVEEHLADESGGLPYIQFQAQQQGDYQSLSQELRLTSNGEGRVQWIGGLFYSHENDHFATTARNNAVGPPTLSVVPTAILNQRGDVYSAYGQIDVAFTDRFNMNLGLRYTSDEKSGDTTVVTMFDTDTGLAIGTRLPMDFLYSRDFVLAHEDDFPAQCAPGVTPCSGPWKKVAQDYSKTGGKLGFDFHFSDHVMAYASYSTGFKAGAFDTRAQAVLLGTGDLPVKPEELVAYELGLKSEFLERRMKLNLTAFYYDWKDLQTFATVPGIGPAFLNLPKSRLTGQELEWQFSPGSDWLLRLYGAHLDTQVTDVGTLGQDAAVEGAPLPQAPEWTFNAGIYKGIAIGDQRLTLSANVRYASEQWGTMTERPNTLIKSTTFFDASLAYEFGRENRYSLTAWGENLTAQKTCLLLGDLDGFTWTNACQPNEGTALYGVSLMARF
ncbi:MAG TPA: TonB-dependent receptor [Steroidobacteraceae bacterium]|nr:TonB-dependent receptor [Steroidobacteraceae bacterium]